MDCRRFSLYIILWWSRRNLATWLRETLDGRIPENRFSRSSDKIYKQHMRLSRKRSNRRFRTNATI